MQSLALAKWTVYLDASKSELPNVSTADVVRQLREGKLAKSDFVWTEGQENWITIEELEKLLLAEIRDRSLRVPRTSSPQVRPSVGEEAHVTDSGSAPDQVSNSQASTEGAQPVPEPATQEIAELKKDIANSEEAKINNDEPAKDDAGEAFHLSSQDQTVGASKASSASGIYGAQAAPQVTTASRVEQDGKPDLGVFSAEETGVIQSFDEGKRRGYVVVEGKGRLLFFRGVLPKNAPKEIVGSKVLAKVARNNQGVFVSSITILSSPVVDGELSHTTKKYQDEIRQLARNKVGYPPKFLKPGQLLTQWSNVPVEPTMTEMGGEKRILDAMPKLAELCLGETWCFDYDKERDKYAILRKYIKYTFYRVFREGKIAFSKSHATFNTGLVDELFEPIFALFARNSRLGSKPYRFIDFCVVGNEGSGKELMGEFALPDRPEPAEYMTSFDQVIFDPRCHVNIQFRHVIDDAIEKGRYPLEFLLKHMPTSMRDQGEPSIKNRGWLTKYIEAMNKSPQKKRAFASDIRYAAEFAQKRARWNYKTAIPNYFPTRNEMSLLLPLALLDDRKPDMAMVCNRVNEHEYYGVTVYPLDMAYESARLVCRPDSDWLTPEITKASDVEEDDTEDEQDSLESEASPLLPDADK